MRNHLISVFFFSFESFETIRFFLFETEPKEIGIFKIEQFLQKLAKQLMKLVLLVKI